MNNNNDTAIWDYTSRWSKENWQKLLRKIAFEGIEGMSDKKKQTLRNALRHNNSITSAEVLENCDVTVYKEGYYFEFEGIRSSFSVYFKDNDGELVEMRKPHESKLNIIYKARIKFWESDFISFIRNYDASVKIKNDDLPLDLTDNELNSGRK